MRQLYVHGRASRNGGVLVYKEQAFADCIRGFFSLGILDLLLYGKRGLAAGNWSRVSGIVLVRNERPLSYVAFFGNLWSVLGWQRVDEDYDFCREIYRL